MDTQSQERLAAIIVTGPDAITAADAEFLRARRDYLNEEQRAIFASALESEVVSDAEAQTVTHVVTQQDLDNNPGVGTDLKVGDEVTLPANPKPLEEMNRNELKEIAKSLSIEIGTFESNASIVEKIHASHAQQ
jgi:hypothetical protein